MDSNNTIMKKILQILLVLLIITIDSYSQNCAKQNEFCNVSISVNKIELYNPFSLPGILDSSIIANYAFHEGAWRHILLSNKYETEILRITFIPGGSKNSILCFQLSKIDSTFSNSYYITNVEKWKTSDRLFLNMSIDSIENSCSKKLIKIDKDTYRFKIEDLSEEDFFKEINVPGYYKEYQIVNNKLVYLEFGLFY